MQENHRKIVVLALMSALAGVTVHAHAQCVTDTDCSDPDTYCQGSSGAGGSGGGGTSTSGTSGGGASGSSGTSGSTGESSNNSGGVGSGTTTTGGDPGSDPAVDQAPLVASTCLLAPEYWCKSDADCAEGQRCELQDRFGACLTEETTCVTDGDCAAGLVCAPSSGGGSTGGSDSGANTGSVGSNGSSSSGTTGGSTTGGTNGASSSGGGAAEPSEATCNPYPPSCATTEDCDAGFECVEDAAGGSNSTGGSDDGVSEPPVFKVCEVKRLDCNSDADCSDDWKCVALDNRSGGLQSPARWGAAGPIKNCYPEGLAALAETVYGLPTAPRLDAKYPGGGDGGTDSGGENSPTDTNGGGGATGGDSNGTGSGGATGSNGENNGPGSTGNASNTGDSQNGTGDTTDPDDCSAARGLSSSSASLILLAFGSLIAAARRRRS